MSHINHNGLCCDLSSSSMQWFISKNPPSFDVMGTHFPPFQMMDWQNLNFPQSLELGLVIFFEFKLQGIEAWTCNI